MRAPLLALATIALSVPAVAAAAPTASAVTTADVRMADFFVRPTYARIEPGDSVRWLQGGSTTHTVTSRAGAPEPFNSGDLQPSQTFTHPFAMAGRYPYHCTIHPEMRGVVQVGPDATAPALTKVKLKLGKKSARVSFRLSEGAKATVRVAAKPKPRKVLRKATSRLLDEGGRSLSLKIAGLKPKRYRVTLSATDREGNSKVVVAGSFAIPAAP